MEKYTVLDPVGWYTLPSRVGLAPRLDTLDGKLIYVVDQESMPYIMSYIAKVLKDQYPKADVRFGDCEHWFCGPDLNQPKPSVLKIKDGKPADALITGTAH